MTYSTFIHAAWAPITSLVMTFMAPFASLAQESSSFFDIRCHYQPTQGAESANCRAYLQLCASSSPKDCRDLGSISCLTETSTIEYRGEFQRSQEGTTIHLKNMEKDERFFAHLTLGPAKSPPRPGRPVVSDSLLHFGHLEAQGECTVALIR